MHILDHPPIGAVRYSASPAAALALERPIRGHRAHRRERCRHWPPAPLARDLRSRRIRARDRNTDRRSTRASRLRHDADAELVANRLADPEAPELAAELIGRALRPDALDHI